MNIEEIFDSLFDYYNVSTISQLAQKMNIGQPSVSKWKKNNSITAIKKKCRELGIYADIFKNTTNSFIQNEKYSQQIGKQHISGDSQNFNKTKDNSNSDKIEGIDADILNLFKALNALAVAFTKKDQLKIELKKLIKEIPELK